jgi:hypothetical protein
MIEHMNRATSLVTIHNDVKIRTNWSHSVVSVSSPADWFGTVKFDTVEAAKIGIDELIATGNYEVRAQALVANTFK